MTSRSKAIIKITAAGGLLIAGAVMTVSRMRHFASTGEERLQVWFYDQSERRLYTVTREAIPPDKGIGGEKDDGVKAVVVAGHGECDDGRKRRIAYLETYTIEHKQLVEGVRVARAAGREYGQPIPEAESGFYEQSTRVRLVDDPTWYDMTTAKGKQIVAEWRSERGADGKALDVCTP